MEPLTPEFEQSLLNLTLGDLADAFAAIGWVHAGPDLELVTKLLADPWRNDHIVQITDTEWVMQHPVIERVSGELFDCELGQQHEYFRELWNTGHEGKYRAWMQDGAPQVGLLP